MKHNYKNYFTVLLVGLFGTISGQDGTMDLSFNTTGKKLSTSDNGEAFNKVSIQSDGKIVAVGTVTDLNYASSIRVVRLMADGAYDNSFGTGGVFTYLAGNECAAYDCVIKPNGKILVTGYSYDYSKSMNMIVLQLNSYGTLDASFGINGVAMLDQGAEDFANAIVVQNDGSIFLAGQAQDTTTSNMHPAIVKFTATGIIDSTFGVNGVAKSSVTEPGNNKFNDILIQSDGKIIAVGITDNALSAVSAGFIARFSANGSVDNTYGTNGRIEKNFNDVTDIFSSAKLLSNDDLIVTGTAASTATDPDAAYRLILMKYNSSGQPVNTFGSGGQVIINPVISGNASMMTGGNALEIQSDGKLLIGGACNNVTMGNQNWGLWKRNADGSADNAFGTNGLVQYDLSAGGSGRDEAAAIAIQPDGKVVLAGVTRLGTPTKQNSVIVRLNNTGSPYVLGLTTIETEIATLTVYPNPVSDILNFKINLKGEKIQYVSVIDVLGKSLIQMNASTMNQNQIQLGSEMPTGIYFLRVTTDKGQYLRKFSIVK